MLPTIRRSTPTITLFEDIFSDVFFAPAVWNEGMRIPLHDVIENEKEYIVEVSMAGVKKENINLKLDEAVLTISAERQESDQKFNRKQTFYGKYEKSFTLPDAVDKENIQAAFENGILKVSIPKTEQQKFQKQISIT